MIFIGRAGPLEAEIYHGNTHEHINTRVLINDGGSFIFKGDGYFLKVMPAFTFNSNGIDYSIPMWQWKFTPEYCRVFSIG